MIDNGEIYTFNTIAIIGAGLMGASIAHAARKNNIARYIHVCETDMQHYKDAENLNIFDTVSTDISCVRDAEIVFLCIPPAKIIETGKRIIPLLKKHAILTDVGSTKAGFYEALSPFLTQDVWYVPGHPIAGTEESGPKAGFAELFDNKYVILTPHPDTSLKALDKVVLFWKMCHAKIEIMTDEEHDFALAVTSHLPHLIAYNLTYTALNVEKLRETEIVKFSASGFRDFTRIASSNPTMWSDIFLLNKKNVLEVLDFFEYGLAVLRQSIEEDNESKLHTIFSTVKDVRQKIIDAKQDTAKVNFGRE